MIERVLIWGHVFEIEIFMDLYILTFPVSKNHQRLVLCQSACVLVTEFKNKWKFKFSIQDPFHS